MGKAPPPLPTEPHIRRPEDPPRPPPLPTGQKRIRLKTRGPQPPPLPAGRKRIRLRPRLAAEAPKRYDVLTAQELDAYGNLLLFAKSQVEGFFAGRHRSPYRGHAAEFADFKEYSPGDDTSRIDWRVYGRSRRLYLRQHEDETDMVLYLMVDASASMAYGGPGRTVKAALAARLAASLAYLMHKQGDKTALTVFADKIQRHLTPGGTRAHLHRVIHSLERVDPRSTTGMADALAQCAATCKKRGELVILSDFLTDHEAMFNELSRFQHRQFGILLLHILDPDERELPPDLAATYIDMETDERVQVDPAEVRRTYRETVEAARHQLAREAAVRGIKYGLVDTTAPYTSVIESYLGFREQRKR